LIVRAIVCCCVEKKITTFLNLLILAFVVDLKCKLQISDEGPML